MAKPGVLTIGVENVDELRNAGAFGTSAIIEIEASASELTGYAALTGTGSTPTIALVAGQRSYTGYDPNGDWATWYRVRYSGASRVSVDWAGDTLWYTRPGHAPFQTGDETAGLLCSLYDVSQRLFGSATVGDNDKETLLDIIRGVSSEIEDYVGAWLAPRPTNPASTMTLRFDVEHPTRSLWLQRAGRYVGIRSLTAINLATQSQPETGGTYTAGTVADVLIRPQAGADGPGWRLELTDMPSGAFRYFSGGYNTVETTGAYGPAAVAGWVQEIALAAVTRRFLGKETAATAIGLGPEGGVRLLAGLPADMAKRLDAHRFIAVA